MLPYFYIFVRMKKRMSVPMKRMLLICFSLCVGMAGYGQQNHYAVKMGEFSKMRAIDSTDVVMLGAGLTEYAGDWNVLLHWKRVRNRGIAGDDTSGLFRRLQQILAGRPKAIFLMVGRDDILNHRSVEETYQSCIKIITYIRRESPGTRLFVESNLPVHETFSMDKSAPTNLQDKTNAQQGQSNPLQGKSKTIAALNVKLRHFCEQHAISYVNLFKSFVRHGTNELRRELTLDGIQLSALGYKVWVFELKRYLVELEGLKS